MKKVLSIAIAAALVAPVAAMADATVYGKVRMSVDNVSVDDGTDDDSLWEIKSQTSRLGVKGSEDLGNGLKAVYKLEFGVDIAGNQRSQASDAESITNITSVEEFGGDQPFSARNAYVGLAGDFGTALIGRHDTPLKMSTGKLDYFADTSADFNSSYMGRFSDRRADGTIVYISPNWSGFTVAGAIIPGENTEANGLADAYTVAGMYSNAGIFLSAAYEAADADTDLLGGNGDHSQWRVGAGYDAGDWKVAAVYEDESIDDADGGDDLLDEKRWAISGGVKLGMGMVKATYQDSDGEDGVALNSNSVTSWALGYDHNMSKRTQLYALYLDSTTEAEGVDDVDRSVFSVGVNHNF